MSPTLCHKSVTCDKRSHFWARVTRTVQIKQIAASIREWGWTVPVLVDEEGTLIAGHGRVLAAQQLGITDVPTMVARVDAGANPGLPPHRQPAGA
jgi:hypothetical protein